MAGERVLVVNADDFGLSPGVCRGILRAADEGVVTSTSALVVAPGFAAHARALRDSGLGVGAHLCAVGEDPPLLSAAEVPTLVDERGRLPLTWRGFVARAARGRIDPADLRREFTAQLELLLGAGITPTHVDSHQNLHLWPAVTAVAFDLAATHGIRAVRLPRTTSRAPTALGVKLLGLRLRRTAQRRSMAVADASVGLDEAGRWSTPSMAAAIDQLGRAGHRTAELATHPGADPDPDRARYQWGYAWGQELDALCSEAVRTAVDGSGFTLGTFADLATAGRR